MNVNAETEKNRFLDRDPKLTSDKREKKRPICSALWNFATVQCAIVKPCNVQLLSSPRQIAAAAFLLQLSIWLILKETIAILFTRWLWCIFHVCLSSTEKISWDFLLCAFTTQCHPLLHWHLPRHHHHHCPQDHHFCFARSTLDELQCGHFVGADRL